MEAFNKLQNDDMTPEIREIDAITDGMLACTELREFRHLMREHENIISKLLGIPSISEKQLNDFNGDIKSLGAWGGDFIMLATDMPRDYVISWLRKRDMNTWFTYKDIALNPVNNS
ncbi:MAG: hypothetical protein H6540_03320 [Bacteroidales bacterium]|nr:hypothetical protein [Bacteroidales bacterium]